MKQQNKPCSMRYVRYMLYKGSDTMPISDKEFYELKGEVQSCIKYADELSQRIGDLERKYEGLYEINKNLSLIAQTLKHLENDISEVKETQKSLTDSHMSLTKKVAELENAPAQETLANLKKIKIAAITAVATMFATGIASAIIVALAK